MRAIYLELRRTVLALFACILALVGLQNVFIWALRQEPYPALTMPAFAGGGRPPGTPPGKSAVTVRVHFAGGGVQSLTPQKLLEKAPRSYRPAIMDRMFSPPPEKPAPAELSRWDRVKMALVPALRKRHRRMTGEYTLPETRRWLERRLHEVYGAMAAVDSVEFVWYRETFAGPLGRRHRRHTGSYVVDLPAAAR